jgi:hypothetical protein
MIEIKIEQRVFTLPLNWEEVTFKKFIDIIQVQQDTLNSELDVYVKILTSLSGEKEFDQALRSMDFEDFSQLKTYFSWITEDLDSDKYKSKEEVFLIDGEKWKLKNDLHTLNVGEMVSLEMMVRDNKLDLTPYEIAFGVLFRRVDEDGNELPFKAEDMVKIIIDYSDKIFVTDIIGKLAFFFDGEKTSSTKNSKVSFQILEKKANTLECQNKKSPNTKQRKKKI